MQWASMLDLKVKSISVVISHNYYQIHAFNPSLSQCFRDSELFLMEVNTPSMLPWGLGSCWTFTSPPKYLIPSFDPCISPPPCFSSVFGPAGTPTVPWTGVISLSGATLEGDVRNEVGIEMTRKSGQLPKLAHTNIATHCQECLKIMLSPTGGGQENKVNESRSICWSGGYDEGKGGPERR